MSSEYRNWHEAWKQAYENMPYRAYIGNQVLKRSPCIGCESFCDGCLTGDYTVPPYRSGAAHVLRLLLGYKTHKRAKNNSRWRHRRCRHGKPINKDRQRLLLQLAGPHGYAIAKAKLAQLGIAHKFTQKPDNRPHYE